MLAERMGRISTSPTMKVAGEAEKLKRQGIDVVDFGAGEPDFPTPEPAKTAAKAAIDQNFTKYTPPAGMADLRQAICARYKADYGVTFTEAETIATAGGKQALFNIAMVLYDPGDEVITHAPYWPTIPEQVKLMGATPIIVATRPEDGFAIHPEAVISALTPRTKAVIINSPANPTGAVISEEELGAIADACAKRGIWIIVDLCYEKLIYDNVPHNLVKVLTDRMRDRALIAGSASKAYSMTGWRCGWILGPKEVVAAANTLQGHSTSNVASISQKAALQALTGSQQPVTDMLNEYRIRRDKLMEWLAVDPRIEVVKPAGAFYLFPRLTKVLESIGIPGTAEFSELLLDEARVALTAGEGFDAPGFVRISYATSLDRLREGTSRILEFVKKRERQGAVAR
ncbi:MAG TPA: pyridoxal phosphate-dependent aminotransferase [Vicinamibacterales bacterium]|jgi:aspartate aminotransferase|nr:pyridoxal phosphate-dependent aminotransferase [Vicinamibacterales bacterium]